MKNKKLLVLVLAAFSASAIGAVGALTGCEHKHSFTWQSNAEGHWEECECGEKGETADHVDVKNNSTDANGKDGKCDVCDYEIKQVVTFNVGEHGVAPDAKEVSYGAKVSKPADPEEEGYNFLGWYKDADCNTAFNFDTDVITDNTVLYAKWEENTTPGESKKYAFALELGSPNPQKLTSKGYSYYKYTATEDGRYQVELGGGINNAKCYFTTSLDEDGATYGNGYDSDKHVYDVYDGDTVYIKLSCAETLGADVELSVLINKVVTEPLPAEGWEAGLYISSDGYTSFVLDREKGQLEYGGGVYGFNYLAGKFNTLSFSSDYESFTVKPSGSTYSMTTPNGVGSTVLLHIDEPAEPFDVSAFAGVYAPAGAACDMITEIILNEEGKGLYTNDFEREIDFSYFDDQYGILTFGQYTLILDVKDGKVAGVKVFGGKTSGTVYYEKTGDYDPDLIPSLPVAENEEYSGTSYKIANNYGTVSWWVGDDQYSLELDNYDKATGKYSVTASYFNNVHHYVLVFEGTGNDAVIKVYGEGDTLVDTLNKYFAVYHDLPASDSGETVTLTSSDFKSNFYHFKVQTAGWYEFTDVDESVYLYYGVSEDAPKELGNATQIDPNKPVKLDEGVIIAVFGYDIPDSVSLTVATTDAPAGRDAGNPLGISGSYQLNLEDSEPYYLEFTAPAEGTYLIGCNYNDGWNGAQYDIHFTVNGNDCGYIYTAPYEGDWAEGFSDDNHYVTLTLTEGQKVAISVDAMHNQAASQWGTTTNVLIMEDYSSGTALALPESDDPVTLSAGGIYKADLSEVEGVTGIKFSGTDEFTIICEGQILTDFEITLTAAQLAMGFKVELGSADVTYGYAYKDGTEKNPHILYSWELGPVAYEYILITAESDWVITADYIGSDENNGWVDVYFYFTINGVNYGYDTFVNGRYILSENASYTVPAGETVLVHVQCANPNALSSTIGVVVSAGNTYEGISSEGHKISFTFEDGLITGLSLDDVAKDFYISYAPSGVNTLSYYEGEELCTATLTIEYGDEGTTYTFEDSYYGTFTFFVAY